MYELARSARGGPLPLHVIARRQGLSQHYLEQLVGPLREAGLVRSVRGAQGGYQLARPAQEITVGDVVRVLEGPIAVTDCTVPGAGVEHCGRAEGCVARGVWERVSQSIARVLDSITLADLCREAGETGCEDAVPNEGGCPAPVPGDACPAPVSVEGPGPVRAEVRPVRLRAEGGHAVLSPGEATPGGSVRRSAGEERGG